MANQRKAVKGGGQRKEVIRLIRFGAVPLLVVFLIIIILAVDHQDEDKAAGGSLGTEAASGTGQPAGTDGVAGSWEEAPAGVLQQEQEGDTTKDNGKGQEEIREDKPAEASIESPDPSQYPLLQDTMLELTGLVQMYCEAKKECDPDLLAQVFGIGDWTDEDKEEERARMELVKASIKSYENISCYSVQGPEADSYVIFPYYEIRYRETETLMPAISWAYVRKNENGQYYMVRDTGSVVNEYIRKVGEKPEVKAILAQIQGRQQEAVASDEVLQRLYGNGGESEVVIG